MANGTLKVENIQTSSGSGTITLGQSGETITVPTGVTVGGLMSNTPAFQSFNNGTTTQSIPHSTWTEINIFDNEALDTDNCFNTSNGRFTPNVAGKYFLNASVFCVNGIAAGFNSIAIVKNGSVNLNTTNELAYITRLATGDSELRVSGFLSMNGSTDYVSVFVNQQVGATLTFGGNSAASTFYFSGYKLIGA